MHILVLSWEFPPRVVGGIARHVGELYPEIVGWGHPVQLVTVQSHDLPEFEVVEGIRVHRVVVPEHEHFFDWVTAMNEAMITLGRRLLNEQECCLIHAHDWLVGDAAIALKQTYKVPLVATIHATEYGRHNGIHTETQAYVSGKEKCLADEAWRVIVCSQYMREELQRALHIAWGKIDIIFNGIRSEKKQHAATFDRLAFRRRFAPDKQKIVYYVGRMTYEKGVGVLLDAAPQVLTALDKNVRFIIIGGGDTSGLQQQAQRLGIGEHCEFTGFMSDEDLDRFQTIADCAVFPSLYEPFGIVALESFAAKVPVVVSNTGGLPEVVTHEKTGIVTYANVANSLAWGILEVLQRPDFAQTLVNNAYADLPKRFNWRDLAAQTIEVYERVITERSQISW